LGASFQTRSLFSHPHLDHHVNQRIEIFVRRDRTRELAREAAAVSKPRIASPRY
jgi:hypothetical protein